MCSFCIKWAKASNENGGPLSVDSVLGGPYCEISDLILCAIGSAALDEILERNGYLLNVCAMRRYSVLLCWKEVCCKVLPLAFWYISGYHWLYCLCGFVFGTDFAVFYIICDVHIHALANIFFTLVRCCIFLMPFWPSYNSLSIIWYNSGGIHLLSLLLVVIYYPWLIHP